jgi:hypothetical protein
VAKMSHFIDSIITRHMAIQRQTQQFHHATLETKFNSPMACPEQNTASGFTTQTQRITIG